MFRRMVEITAKCAWQTILFELGSIIMHVVLMVLIIVVASVIASSATTWSIIVSSTATATSTLIIAIIIIIIAAVGGIQLSVVALILASVFILLSPYPLLRTSIWFSTAILAPEGSTASVVTSIILIVVVIIDMLFFLFRGRGGWLRLLLWFGFTFTFLSSLTCCTFKWFG